MLQNWDIFCHCRDVTELFWGCLWIRVFSLLTCKSITIKQFDVAFTCLHYIWCRLYPMFEMIKLPDHRRDVSLPFYTTNWLPRLCCIGEPPDSSVSIMQVFFCAWNQLTQMFKTVWSSSFLMVYICICMCVCVYQYLNEEKWEIESKVCF